jgi:CHASE3 domain sensor protein
LLETWKRRRRLTLTVSAYREAGGVRGAIAQTAERTLQSLPEADQTIARQIFLTLTDISERAEPTRRRVDLSEFADCADVAQRDRVLAILAAVRLVTIDEHVVTVAHEALIRHWPRLRGWIEADRAGLHTHRRLTAAARWWENLHREPAALFRGARLATANEWATEHPHDLSPIERDFLTASQTLQRHDQLAAKRATRRLRALASGLAVLTAIVTILAVWALGQRSTAQQQRSIAQQQRSTAQHEAAQATARALQNSLMTIENGLRGYLATHNDRFLSPVNDALQSYPAQLHMMEHQVLSDPAQRQLTRTIRNAIRDYVVLWAEPVIGLGATNHLPDARRQLNSNLARGRLDAISTLFNRLYAREQASIKDHQDNATPRPH